MLTAERQHRQTVFDSLRCTQDATSEDHAKAEGHDGTSGQRKPVERLRS